MGRSAGKSERQSSTLRTDEASPTVEGARPSARGREVLGILLLSLSLFVGLSVASLQLGNGTLMGPCGAWVGLAAYAFIGLGAYLAAGALLNAAVKLLRDRPVRLRSVETAACVFGAVFASVLLHLATGSHRLRGHSTGGLVGEYGAELLVALLGTAGTVLVALTGLALSLVASTSLTMAATGRAFTAAARGAWQSFARASLALFPARRRAARDEMADDEIHGSREDDQAVELSVVASPSSSEVTCPYPAPAPARSISPTSRRPNRASLSPTCVDLPVFVDGTPETEGSAPKIIEPLRDLKQKRKKKSDPSIAEPTLVEFATARTERTPSATPAPVGTDDNSGPLPEIDATPIALTSSLPAAAPVSAVPPPPPAPSRKLALAPSPAPSPMIAAPVASPIAPSPAPSPVTAAPSPAPSPIIAAPVASPIAPSPQPPQLPMIAAPVASPIAALDAEADRTAPSVSAFDGPSTIAPSVRRLPPPDAAPAPSISRAPLDYIRLGSGDYRLPDISLLDFDGSSHGDLDRQGMLDLAGRLERTLADYGVKGRVSEIHPGPVVTMYEFVPQAGTKISKITALSNDLAMALEALKVRIVAPIPGKAAVGIEVPNKVRETVYLKEIIGSEAFAKSKTKLSMALGKDIAGHPVCVDLAKMPHLLVAGTTGSGKSVSVNGMICSLLFNASPEDVKMIMIDPKMLELSIYEGIPHLLLPVVTDPKKANLALRWAVDEMERRYDLISKSGVRDIVSYNKKLERLSGGESGGHVAPAPAPAPMMLPAGRITIAVTDENGIHDVEVEATEEAVIAAGGEVNSQVLDEISQARALAHKPAEPIAAPQKKLPYIVVVIDEFADLMMVASKEVEMSVARIAQKARAAGIHLLLATQRPSVDVITGLIKANFPSRIAFQVASKIDARTILDQQGAESLLGMGDMLFTDRGLALRRIHGPLVTDVEIHRLVDFLKAQGKPVYDLDILKPREDGEGGGAAEEEDSDEMYDQALMIVSEMRLASTSMLQRRLRLGYNRAARMIERMEREGIVGPADGAKPREVLIQSHAA